MSTIIKNKFKNEHDGIIKIKCDTKEITGYETIMTIDLSASKIMEVSNDRHYWPENIYAWSDSSRVDIEADYNCDFNDEQYKIKPKTGVTFFTLKLSTNLGNSKLGGDPDETVTVGEEPPQNEKGKKWDGD
ncbi:MAG: hypothetical protein GTO45_38705 [Candidatus Aminicenantes bacterium]|nr:hypothetical protein [Candidatus Aminicenantes bacterium]NIM84556.1 hypothetical protein [Candidatus Aminicenantes bacterium]NIN24076.1 hypothetical protein [Candidatus Aminicenantes bacterium]NIN47782.1 hypothetical protein [Candidatus Aminicenantes bacterium]NIN90720.1 hypothetical protein [Candidatus Aminicenantes bacterium]